jgi:parallel beta-helix repeat protein
VVSKPWQPTASIKGTEYELHDPIEILSDNDFELYGFNGLGTPDKPYMIDGYDITYSTKDLIYIENTTMYFKISNCYLNGLDSGYSCIWLDNVTHGIIDSNIISNTDEGIVLSSSGRNTLSSNRIYDCANNGILLFSSSNNTLSSNTIFNCAPYGIYLLSSSNNNTLLSNTISSCSEYGIILFESSINNTLSSNMIFGSQIGIFLMSSNNTLSSNRIYSCSQLGIWLGYGSNNILSYNTISNCGQSGIELSSSSNNTLFGNMIFNCDLYGFYLHSSSSNNTLSYNTIMMNYDYGLYFHSISETNNTVKWNNFLDNNIDSGNHQAYDDGTNNNISYNYWYRWILPDPYSIDGSANNFDSYPLTNPLSPLVNILTPLTRDYGTDTVTVMLSGNAVEYSYYIEGIDGNNLTWTTNVDRTFANDGTYTLHAYGKILSNTSHASVTFTIDTTPPTVTIVSPTETNYTTTDTITVDLSGDADVVHYWYYIEGVHDDNKTWTQNINETLDDGDYILHAYGDDPVGNTASVSVMFSIDTMAPTIILEFPTNDTIHHSETIINVNVTDSHLDTVLYNWDGITNKTWSGDYETSLPTIDTQHVLYVYANDSLGRWASQIFVFTTDDTGPIIDITSPTETTYNQNSVTLNYSVSDGTTTIYINGVTNTTALPSGTIITDLSEGTYNITIVAVDSIGNIGRDSVIFTVEIAIEASSETTSETTSKKESTPQVGSFPGLFTVLLFLVPIAIFHRRHRIKNLHSPEGL